jgi:DNA primase small subunit
MMVTTGERGRHMQNKDRVYALRLFAEYYSKASFPVASIEKREFGIGNVKKIDARHLAFANESELRVYLTTNTPMFISHSTAYYEFPDATPIERKNRQCADLLFDLDLHADGKYTVYQHLSKVKEDAMRLVKDFLLDDFGIKKEYLSTVFSGNRGFHVHVRDPEYQVLGSEARKEIIDYVVGHGLDYQEFYQFDEKKRLLGPRPDDGGYRGRMARDVLAMLKEKPTSLSRTFNNEKIREMFVNGITNEGNWSKTSLKLNDLLGRLKIVADKLPLRSVDADTGVTHDMSKLIRLENSIHGETGFIAKVVNDIEKFNPMCDARLPLNGSTKIRFTENVPELFFGDSTYGPFEKDNEKELDKEIALFFVLKDSAVILFA